jgi:propanol-preferring alcohol dehydrogenase
MQLAAQNKIRHTIETFAFEEVNEKLDVLRRGEIVGRAVLMF